MWPSFANSIVRIVVTWRVNTYLTQYELLVVLDEFPSESKMETFCDFTTHGNFPIVSNVGYHESDHVASLWRYLVTQRNSMHMLISQWILQMTVTCESQLYLIVTSPGDSSQSNSHNDFIRKSPNDVFLKLIMRPMNDITFWFIILTAAFATICDSEDILDVGCR